MRLVKRKFFFPGGSSRSLAVAAAEQANIVEEEGTPLSPAPGRRDAAELGPATSPERRAAAKEEGKGTRETRRDCLGLTAVSAGSKSSASLGSSVTPYPGFELQLRVSPAQLVVGGCKDRKANFQVGS